MSPSLPARCDRCGYRRELFPHARCAECGCDQSSIAPPDRAQVNEWLLRFVAFSAMGWSIPLAIGLLGVMSVSVNSLDLFMLAVMLMLASFVIVPTIGCVLAWRWTRRAMNALWAIRDGETGPWSSAARHIGMGACLFVFELCGAAIGFVIAWSIFQDYPAGWP